MIFASKDNPLHCSSIPALMQCGWRAVVECFEQISPVTQYRGAADTGSAVHAAVAEWHKNRQKVKAALQNMRDRLAEYPLADLEIAEQHFRRYSADPRNREAEVIAVEKEVRLELLAEPNIVIVGRVDQIRLVEGTPKVVDIKTSKKVGADLLNEHLYQIAIYAAAASQSLCMCVWPGSLICTSGYLKDSSPAGVYWDYSGITPDAVEQLLTAVVRRVKLVRQGGSPPQPGDHCRWCPLGGVTTCVPKYVAAVTWCGFCGYRKSDCKCPSTKKESS